MVAVLLYIIFVLWRFSMKVIIDSAQNIAAMAAQQYVALLKRKPNAILGGATGSTPLGLYAELILSTAGDARGFSTCLSASARGLRYRLRSIVKPEKKRRGILLLSALSFLLVASCGLLCVAVG